MAWLIEHIDIIVIAILQGGILLKIILLHEYGCYRELTISVAMPAFAVAVPSSISITAWCACCRRGHHDHGWSLWLLQRWGLWLGPQLL